MDASTVVGLRHRALIAVMTYTFARFSVLGWPGHTGRRVELNTAGCPIDGLLGGAAPVIAHGQDDAT
jgi:hypothetical protein